MPRLIRKSLSETEMLAECEKWNIPDWRTPEAYKHLENASEDRWRWEFVRRNDDYRILWDKGATHGYEGYGLYQLRAPQELRAPRFRRTCYQMSFTETDNVKQFLHYNSLVTSNGASFIFSLNPYAPLEPQFEIIRKAYASRGGSRNLPEEKPKRNRQGNRNGRTKTELLRVLDAKTVHASLSEISEIFDRPQGISDPALRRTIKIAQDYWQRL